MLNLRFAEKKRILCLGAHSDDIEIGCGGTVLRLLAANKDLEVVWAVFSGNPSRQKEAKASARGFLAGAGKSRICCYRFRDGYFPDQWARIKENIEDLRREVEPDVIFTHYRDDRHQDHRVLSDLAWNTFRDHLILEYEIPKYDGDLGAPNAFVSLAERLCCEKTELLMRHFQTQKNKHWFRKELFLGLMRIRGMECASPSGFAEAFYCRKLILG